VTERAVSGVAGIVLAGGRSTRMGRPKAALPWQGSTLVASVAQVLAETLDGPVVVVGAPGQVLPRLPGGVETARDTSPGRGPVEGLAAGLRAVRDRSSAAYVSATDVPLLQPAFVRLVAGMLTEGIDAAVPRVGGRMHPLAAAYRASLLPVVERLIAQGQLRATDLLGAVPVRWLAEAELRAVDPDLDSLRNLNTPEEYEAARAMLGS
jgi:molybdopterin-guanine dinucleotide biosynthesis protein A